MFTAPNQVLELKVHTMYQRARQKAEAKEQRNGSRSIAADLRAVYVAARAHAKEEKEVKERLRQLRAGRVEEDLDNEPLLNEADSAEVLGEEVDEEEAPLVVPDGFSIRLDPPSAEALTFVGKPASAASIALVGWRVMRKWEGFGWQVGTITSVNEDGRCKIGGEKVNFYVRYDMDPESEPPVPHILELEEYRTDADANYDSWLLLRADATPDGGEAGGEAGGEVGGEGTGEAGGEPMEAELPPSAEP